MDMDMDMDMCMYINPLTNAGNEAEHDSDSLA